MIHIQRLAFFGTLLVLFLLCFEPFESLRIVCVDPASFVLIDFDHSPAAYSTAAFYSVGGIRVLALLRASASASATIGQRIARIKIMTVIMSVMVMVMVVIMMSMMLLLLLYTLHSLVPGSCKGKETHAQYQLEDQ